MSGPAPADVDSRAQVLGQDPRAVYAYAGTHGMLPADVPTVQNNTAQLANLAQTYGVDLSMIEYYAWSQGILPGSRQNVIDLGTNKGYMTANGNQLSAPAAGVDYIYAPKAVATPTTTTPTVTNPLGFLQNLNLGSLTQPPNVYYLGAAIGGYFLLKGSGGRRR